MSGNNMFDKFKTSFNKGVENISNKTSSSLEKVRIKNNIDDLKKDVDVLYKTIGGMVHFKHVNKDTDYSEILFNLESIDSKLAEIEVLELELKEIDERNKEIADNSGSKIICPNCSAEYESEVKFCSKCGTKLI